MKKLIILIIILLSGIYLKAQKPELYPYNMKGKWGYSDKDGKVIIEPEYTKAEFFKDGLAKVSKGHRYGIINTKGEIIVPIEYYNDDLGRHYHRRIYFEKDGKVGYFNSKGEIAIEPQYESKYSFIFQPITAVWKDTLYGFIDTSNNVVIPFQFRYVTSMSELGYATFKTKEGYGMIDIKGNVIVPAIYKENRMHSKKRFPWLKQNHMILNEADGGSHGYIFNNGKELKYYGKTNHNLFSDYFYRHKYVIFKLEGPGLSTYTNPVYGLVNEDGNVVLEVRGYDFATHCNKNAVVVGNRKGNGNVWGMLNLKGEVIIKPKYDYIARFNPQGIGRFGYKKKTGFINDKGEIVQEPIDFQDIKLKFHRYGIVKYHTKDKKVGLINYTGNIIVPAEKGNSYSFTKHHLIIRKKDKKQQLLYLDGKPVNNVWYGVITEKDFGLVVKNDGYLGILDTNGKVIVPPTEYTWMYQLDSLSIKVKKDGKLGVIDYSGKVTLPVVFKSVKHIRPSGNFWVEDEEDKWSMVDRYGKQIHEFKYDRISYSKKGYYCVYKSDWGLVDPYGKLVVPYVCYSVIKDYNKEGIFGVVKSGSSVYGYIGEDFTVYFTRKEK